MLEIGGIQLEEKKRGILSPIDDKRVDAEWIATYSERIKEVLVPNKKSISPVILAKFDLKLSLYSSNLLEVPPFYVDIWHQDYPQGLPALAIVNKSKKNRRGSTEWRPFFESRDLVRRGRGIRAEEGVFAGRGVKIDWFRNPESVFILNNQTGLHRGLYKQCKENDKDNYLYQMKIF